MDYKKFGGRLAFLRSQHNMTQKQLACALSERLGPGVKKEEKLSYITISAYERGNRMPIVNTLIAMAQLFNVSLDYLCCIDDLPEIKRTEISTVDVKDKPIVEPDILIDTRELKKYHGNPVFLVAPPEKHIKPRWGILDYEKKRVVLYDAIIPLTTDMKLFQYRPIEAQFMDISFKQPLTISPLMNTEKPVWCEMLNAEPVIKGQYNGWYQHNEQKTALINMSNGLTLPYSGCGISYNAYLQ